MKGKQKQIGEIDKSVYTFIVLSGFATGASWSCYYYAIQNGIVCVVVSIDKLSIIVTVIFSYFIFEEKFDRKSFTGLCLMLCGTVAIWTKNTDDYIGKGSDIK